jgi:hypothetical protein
MAKTIPISEETHEQLKELQAFYQNEMLLPIKVNQAEAVAIAINESYKKRKNK